jgi:sugar lactone lactonase YvrE
MKTAAEIAVVLLAVVVVMLVDARRADAAPGEALAAAAAGPARGKRDARLEIVATFPDHMPAGVALSRQGRIFVTFPRWESGIEATCVEIMKDGTRQPFPDAAAHDQAGDDHIGSAQGIAIDAKDRLWLLDSSQAKLRVYDIDTRRMLREYGFERDVLGDGFYLNDVRVDPSGGFGGLAYISDSLRGGVIVLDLASNEAWRRLENAPQARAEDGFVATVEGRTFKEHGNTDGIALSPDGATMYFTPFSRREVYAVPTAALVDQRIPDEQVSAQITKVASKPSANDGICADAEGRVYTTDYEDQSIRRVTPGKDPESTVEVIVQDERILWPDAVCIHGGYVYITANQMNRMPHRNGGKDLRQKPYALLRYPVDARSIGQRDAMPATESSEDFKIDYDTTPDPALQAQIEQIDASLRAKFAMATEHTAVGVLDLRTNRLAMIHPDRIEYAASVPKIGILLAYFELHPEAAKSLDPTARHELGLMIKASSNEMAARFSRELGLKAIQDVLNRRGFYDAARGGGIWVGKHYGKDKERYGDPVADHSHAATVRQLLRYFLLLHQGKLVSADASATMREIFASPDIPHDEIKFVKALAGRDATLLRKWGTWQDWRHDAALVSAPGREYILVALTKHPKGDDYLVALAQSVDDALRLLRRRRGNRL